MLLFGFDKRI